MRAGRPLHDRQFFGPRRIADDDVEHEPVELRFRQRIGALLLDRVLRRQHEERLRQPIGLPGRGDVVLLHRFEQGRLRLRRRAVDLVGQDHVGEDRPRQEDEPPAAGLGIVLQNVGAGDVRRHQVRRELDPLERQIQDSRNRADEQRLGQPRHADEQAMPSAEQAHQHLLDDLLLADDHLADLGRSAVRRRPPGRERPGPRTGSAAGTSSAWLQVERRRVFSHSNGPLRSEQPAARTGIRSEHRSFRENFHDVGTLVRRGPSNRWNRSTARRQSGDRPLDKTDIVTQD